MTIAPLPRDLDFTPPGAATLDVPEGAFLAADCCRRLLPVSQRSRCPHFDVCEGCYDEDPCPCRECADEDRAADAADRAWDAFKERSFDL